MSQETRPNSSPPNVDFLAVPALLESSQPRLRGNWLMPSLAVLLVLVLGSTYLSSRSPAMKAVVDAFSQITMIAILFAMMVMMWMTVRKHREERLRVEAIEELLQLRRWPQAAGMLHASLSRPALTPSGRVQMLLFLSTVLARYNRFDDAIAVHQHLLETIDLDPSTAHALQLARAMAMLREDHLFDADRAINELRRGMRGANSRIEKAARDAAEVAAADPAGTEPQLADIQPIETPMLSAGLALIEMYRDVKTGHPAEAIEMFKRSLPAMQKQLGHRVGDAHALVARAYDFLSDPVNAQRHWEKATLLSPAVELLRRYPELSSTSAKYRPADRPPEIVAEAA